MLLSVISGPLVSCDVCEKQRNTCTDNAYIIIWIIKDILKYIDLRLVVNMDFISDACADFLSVV